MGSKQQSVLPRSARALVTMPVVTTGNKQQSGLPLCCVVPTTTTACFGRYGRFLGGGTACFGRYGRLLGGGMPTRDRRCFLRLSLSFFGAFFGFLRLASSCCVFLHYFHFIVIFLFWVVLRLLAVYALELELVSELRKPVELGARGTRSVHSPPTKGY